jgi:hypothetical protein
MEYEPISALFQGFEPLVGRDKLTLIFVLITLTIDV